MQSLSYNPTLSRHHEPPTSRVADLESPMLSTHSTHFTTSLQLRDNKPDSHRNSSTNLWARSSRLCTCQTAKTLGETAATTVLPSSASTQYQQLRSTWPGPTELVKQCPRSQSIRSLASAPDTFHRTSSYTTSNQQVEDQVEDSDHTELNTPLETTRTCERRVSLSTAGNSKRALCTEVKECTLQKLLRTTTKEKILIIFSSLLFLYFGVDLRAELGTSCESSEQLIGGAVDFVILVALSIFAIQYLFTDEHAGIRGVKVFRDGVMKIVAIEEVIVGDIILIEPVDITPCGGIPVVASMKSTRTAFGQLARMLMGILSGGWILKLFLLLRPDGVFRIMPPVNSGVLVLLTLLVARVVCVLLQVDKEVHARPASHNNTMFLILLTAAISVLIIAGFGVAKKTQKRRRSTLNIFNVYNYDQSHHTNIHDSYNASSSHMTNSNNDISTRYNGTHLPDRNQFVPPTYDSHYTTEPESQYANVQLTSPYGAPYSHVSHQNYQPMPHRPFRSNYPQPPGLPFSYFHPGGYPLPPPPSPPRHESHLQREVCLADIQSRAHTE